MRCLFAAQQILLDLTPLGHCDRFALAQARHEFAIVDGAETKSAFLDATRPTEGLDTLDNVGVLVHALTMMGLRPFVNGQFPKCYGQAFLRTFGL